MIGAGERLSARLDTSGHQSVKYFLSMGLQTNYSKK
jgi:hypothetical protein